MKKNVTILETTLRDGSYAVNFSFTSADTAVVCKELESVGFEYIEIGHGVGLNASNSNQGAAVQSDEEYMEAAASVLKKAKYGMFCIPGIARVKDIDTAAKHGMGFIRIGTNVTEVNSSEPFIKRAKEKGMFVAANYMKSYALSPNKFAQQVKLSEKYGADMVYIVDSAGGMFGRDIKSYYDAIREVSDIAIGFHGHNNLGMAVSNSIEAAEIGCEFIDASLQGLGRSSGNAPTEMLVLALIKLGYGMKIDILKLLELGQKYVQTLITAKGQMLLDTVSGFADFHSSYMHFIQKYSAKYQINPAVLIIELCKKEKVEVKEELVDAIARKIQKDHDIYLGKYDFSRYVGHEQDED